MGDQKPKADDELPARPWETEPIKGQARTRTATREWIEELKSISILELSERIKAIEETFGVSVSSPLPVTLPSKTTDVESSGEQIAFTVSLDAVGDRKIQVIKVVRAVTGLGLKEAKELVDSAPSDVKEGVARSEADSVKAQIEEAGGSVSVR